MFHRVYRDVILHPGRRQIWKPDVLLGKGETATNYKARISVAPLGSNLELSQGYKRMNLFQRFLDQMRGRFPPTGIDGVIECH